MSLDKKLEAILRDAPNLMHVMETARELDLPDWLIFSGAIYQKVLNHLTGREPDYGLKDYDLGYFDGSDLSWDAEDVVIKQVAARFQPPFSELVEVRNQARVHLWFADRFKGDEPYPALTNTAEALSRFTSGTFAVGARLDREGRMEIFAPFGLVDIFSMRLRPNPIRKTSGFQRTAEAAKARWPELRIEA